MYNSASTNHQSNYHDHTHMYTFTIALLLTTSFLGVCDYSGTSKHIAIIIIMSQAGVVLATYVYSS